MGDVCRPDPRDGPLEGRQFSQSLHRHGPGRPYSCRAQGSWLGARFRLGGQTLGCLRYPSTTWHRRALEGWLTDHGLHRLRSRERERLHRRWLPLSRQQRPWHLLVHGCCRRRRRRHLLHSFHLSRRRRRAGLRCRPASRSQQAPRRLPRPRQHSSARRGAGMAGAGGHGRPLAISRAASRDAGAPSSCWRCYCRRPGARS